VAIDATHAAYQIFSTFQPGGCAFEGFAGQITLSRANEGMQAKYFYGCRYQENWHSDNNDKKNSHPALHDVSSIIRRQHSTPALLIGQEDTCRNQALSLIDP
jgi:hypothetical protein